MRRKSTKIAAALLSTMLIMQGGLGSADINAGHRVQAAEQMTEEHTAEVQTVTEAQTQAATEAQTQAATEAQTQAATEAQTQAATEAQTQAVTETQSNTESETEKKTEKETVKETEKITEKETERSERKNNGSKIKASKITDSLKKLLPYLLAGKTVTVPEKMKDTLGLTDTEDTADDSGLVLQGEKGSEAVAGLKAFSLELADAKSSSDVSVINLYADETGSLDTAQLDQVLKNEMIDVTKKYVVVNVIADRADQDLTFSGYDMVLNGETVVYKEATQPGDILYNFAAMDGEKFTAYKGTLTLKNNLQGTFLAPQAEVTIASELAGAVFAEKITVTDSADKLLHIVFAEGKEAPQTEAESEPEEARAETEPESQETGAEIESETQETAAMTETESETQEMIVVTEVETEVRGTNSETQTEISEEETDTATLELVEETDTEAAQPVDLMTQTENGQTTETSLTLSVVDESGAQVPSAVFVVKDQNKEILKNQEGQPLYYVQYAGAKAVLDLKDLAAAIQDQTGHTYYLSQLQTAEGYLIDPEDKAFRIENGEVVLGTGAEETGTQNPDRELTITNKKVPAEKSGTLTITGKTYYKNVLLTAEKEHTRYAALFEDEAMTKRVSAVLPLKYEVGQTETASAVFAGLAQNGEAATYYLAQTDAYGTVIPAADQEAAVVQAAEGSTVAQLAYQAWVGDAVGNQVKFEQITEGNREPKQARLDFYLDQEGYTEEAGYSYQADVNVTKKVLDQSGSAMATGETFYFNIYPISAGASELGQALFDQPQAIAMNQSAAASATVSIKMNAASSTFAIREVDKNGVILTADTQEFAYAVSYPENPDGNFTVFCKSAVDDKNQPTGKAETVNLTIENRALDSLVKLQAEDQATGKLLDGITLVVKNKSGKVVLVNGSKTLTSQKQAIELKNVLTAGETYYLSALQAPSGYAAAQDVAFTVNKSGETIVSLQYSPAVTTDYKLTLSKQVYSGKYQVYAYDTTEGKYAAAGAYTFYAALFADQARTQKVSDVQQITVTGLSGTTVFKNLEKGQTYYIGETDEYGQLKKSDSEVAVKYASKGVVTMSEKSKTSIIQNAYTSLPDGYRYTGTLTITKNVTDKSGNASAVTETFYAGIYRQADYSDKPTIVKLELKNASTASVKKRILLSGSKDMVYYIAEVDKDGNRITEDSDFTYTVTIDQPTATISKGANTTVTLTNKAKETKATLYLTKKVYNGTELQKVNETFYAGLFKDAAFTKPYTKPIAMKLENKSELTLKLSLNLGTSSSTKIYIAEVDADGNVIKDEQNFGYQIRMVNSTVEFTQDRREVQTILLNSKYGTTSSNDWNSIFEKDGNDSGSMNDGYWGISGNGDVSNSTAAQTGDDTPIISYMLLMCLALAAMTVLFRKRRKI